MMKPVLIMSLFISVAFTFFCVSIIHLLSYSPPHQHAIVETAISSVFLIIAIAMLLYQPK